MKRLKKSSELIFPELFEPKRKVQQFIRWLCPDCELNDSFRIIEVLKKVDITNIFKPKAGLYKCECTACGFISVIKSKNPADSPSTDKIKWNKSKNTETD